MIKIPYAHSSFKQPLFSTDLMAHHSKVIEQSRQPICQWQMNLIIKKAEPPFSKAARLSS